MKKKVHKFQDIDKKPNLSLDGFNVLDPKKMLFWKFGVAAGVIVFILQMIIFANPPHPSQLFAEQLEYLLSFFIPTFGMTVFIGVIGMICLKIGLKDTKQNHTSEKLLRKYIPMGLYIPMLAQIVIVLVKLIL